MQLPDKTEPAIVRARPEHFEDVWFLLQEYFEAVKVQIRDDRDAIAEDLQTGRVDFWIAYANHEPVGCIVLRPLATISQAAGEIKRLYVRPPFRGAGIAALLLQTLERAAASKGLTALYLDTKDDLTAAIRFYQRSGYTACGRYNDNPQATMFLRKSLPSGRAQQASVPD